MTTLRVGGLTVSYDLAARWAKDYLVNNPGRSSYPAYDAYPGSDTDEIAQQDLLAIVLLNVSDKPVPTYYALETLIEPLNALLASPDIKGTLEDASEATLDAVAKLFSVLDKDRPKGIRMAKVAKVVARKRPGLIPVFDRYIGFCYTGCSTGPVRPVDGRTWEGYSRAWLEAVQEDMVTQLPQWQALAAIAPGPEISESDIPVESD